MITGNHCFQCFQNVLRTRYLLTPPILASFPYIRYCPSDNMSWKQHDGPPRKMNRFQSPAPNRNTSFDGTFPKNFNTFGGPPSIFDLELNFNNMRPPPPPPEMPIFMNCGDLRPVHVNLLVELEGKVNRARLGRFIELKDQFGVVQLVAPSGNTNVVNRFQNLPLDSLISVVGYVRRRPENLVNTSLATGGIEVQIEEILRVMKIGRSERLMTQSGGKRHYSTLAASQQKIILSLTSTEFKKTETSDNCRQYFVNREHTCDSLRLEDVDKIVTLVGWLDGKQKLNSNRKFMKLYDGHGYTQLVVDHTDLKETLGNVAEGEFLLVTGNVTCRPKGQQMMLQPNGQIELFVKDVKIIDPTAMYDGPIKPSPVQVVETELLASAPPVKPFINQYTSRTHNCGELRADHTNETVTLCGWLQFQRMQKFFTLRDSYGETQVIVPEHLSASVGIDRISYESILKVRGVVISRPPSMRNSKMATGDIEVSLESLEVLNSARSNLPMEVRGFNRAKEATRLEYRYIDLRFEDMQRNLRLRSAVLMKMREYLINYAGFVEVETPTLFRRTPGGAQEFVVPTRKSGHFYSLVQSPQQYKQMLMSGAIDRYFQIARCYRDESTRPDRQPEFTQLDVELSFTDRDSIIMLIENLLKHCWPVGKPPITLPFPRMTYDEAMAKYGCDKPDITFDMLLNDVTDVLTEYKPASNAPDDFCAYAVVCSGTDKKKYSMLKIINTKLAADLDCKFAIARISKDPMQWAKKNEFTNLSETAALDLIQNLDAKAEDVIQIAYGAKNAVQNLMGKIRLSTMEFLESTKIAPPRSDTPYKFLWVLDFPMFCKEDTGGEQLGSTHHPFTAPHPDDVELLKDSSAHLRIRSLAYDLVLNGMEVGGGSIRIHDAQLQRKVLDDILKIDHSHLSHLIDALATGCPPHGGIALGLDRLLCFLCEAKSIRDVMAFPKSLDGRDPLSKAPVPITDEELKMYHIRVEGDARTKEETHEKMSTV